MNEHDLMTALEERAHDVPVGPAPLDAMTRRATRTRRRSGLVGGMAALAVVTTASVGIAQALSDPDPAEPAIAVQPEDADVAPDGFTYVGMGAAAIAVPDAWPLGETECNGVPTVTTYVVDTTGGVSCAMFSAFPDDTDAIEVQPISSIDTTSWTPIEVEGVDALRSPTETAEPDPAFDTSVVTSASIAVPSAGVVFTVRTTVDPANIDDLLGGVVILDEHVGVPGFFDLQSFEPDAPRQDEAYVQRLELAGLEVDLLEQTDKRRVQRGTVIAVSPLPGTVVEPGSTVRVTVAR